ncbi:MAG: threonylcarbamoyl-AMP synthase [Methanobacteriota archaeon]|nr:MAG: threonylcarbamoyl-AMP synthase [Euryarchaeota archaeon]
MKEPLILGCTAEAIKKAAEIIGGGGLVVYPTDTLYGLGCSALDEGAIKRLYAVKRRDLSKPVSIAVCDLRMLRRYTSFDEKAMQVLERFLPGPVTIILQKKGLPDLLTGGGRTIGIRIPENRAALRLIMNAGVPVVSTSANVSGREPPETPEEVLEQIPGVDLILDAGRLEGPPSTVIDLTTEKPRILREGRKPSWEIAVVLEEIYGGFEKRG